MLVTATRASQCVGETWGIFVTMWKAITMIPIVVQSKVIILGRMILVFALTTRAQYLARARLISMYADMTFRVVVMTVLV